uniref:Uncharacterized protein n=1 Tax=viral metagenome TaxID=1070528 RepID=A0A6M3IIB7_9ZZZZ
MDGQLFLDYMDILIKQEKSEVMPATMMDIINNKWRAFELGDIGACEFAKRTLLLRREESLTTVASQRDYDCPPDFISIARKGYDERTDVIRHTKSGETQGELIYRRPYSHFWNFDTSQEEVVPGEFDIVENPLSPVEIAGTTTSAGTVADGEATLTNINATFTDGSDLAYARYRVRNTTSGKPHRGIVLNVEGDTELKTAIFQDGVAQSWGNGDTYAIQSSNKFKLRFGYKTSTAGDTVVLDYHCLPPPVFSPIGMWGFPDPSHVMAIATYAVWLLKLRNIQEQRSGDVNVAALTSDRLYMVFQQHVDDAKADRRRRFYVPRHSPLMGVL